VINIPRNVKALFLRFFDKSSFYLTKSAPIIISSISLIVSISGIITTIYFQYFRENEDFVVSFRPIGPAFNDLDIDKFYFSPKAEISIAITFSNRGNRPTLIEDVKLAQVFGEGWAGKTCTNESIWISLNRAEDTRFGGIGKPIFSLRDNTKQVTLNASRFELDGREIKHRTFIVEPGKTAVAITSFPTSEIYVSRYRYSTKESWVPDYIVFCPLITYSSHSGFPRIALCKADIFVQQMPSSNRQEIDESNKRPNSPAFKVSPIVKGEGLATSVSLLPIDEKFCSTGPHYKPGELIAVPRNEFYPDN
jgi:hypothetical protein